MFAKIVSRIFLPAPTLAYSFFRGSEKEEEEDYQAQDHAYLKKVISEVSSESENSLKNFIGILEKCITTVSKRYRQNILQQIGVLIQDDNALLKTEEFLKLQTENDRLKAHLDDYKVLAENSGKMAYNQAVSALHSGLPDPGDIVCKVYCRFEKLYTSEYKLNEDYEKNLSLISETTKKKVGEMFKEWK